MLTKTPRIPGLDGRKMSKSYGNAITLSETDEEIRKKTKVMVTDPARKRRTDPGNPDVCPVYDWHKLFSTAETLTWAAEGCRTAGIGCIECKAKMADHLIEWIRPVRERRVEYEKNPKRVLEIFGRGVAEGAGGGAGDHGAGEGGGFRLGEKEERDRWSGIKRCEGTKLGDKESAINVAKRRTSTEDMPRWNSVEIL